MKDIFEKMNTGINDPAGGAFSITPDDSNDLPKITRAIYVGTAGDLVITTVKGDTVTLVGVSGLLPIRVIRVAATGTTATAIVGLT